MKTILSGGAIALVLSVLVYFAFFWGQEKNTTSHTKKTSVQASKPEKHVVKKTVRSPALPPQNEQTKDTSKPVVREYVSADGVKVRDHRAGNHPPSTRPYTLPSNLSKVKSGTLLKVFRAIEPAAKQCIAEHVKTPENNAKASALLAVSISDEELQVDKVTLTIQGVPENEDTGLKNCLQGVFETHTQHLQGAEDVALHHMTFPFRLR